ncbi:MAG: CRP/FNR family transcriptional regulator [Bacteroidia bacterium]|jgi:CRP/FNR family transcriptional regulator
MGKTVIQKDELGRIILEYLPQISSVVLRESISENGRLIELEKGETLMEVGSTIRSVPILLDGSIKVLREDDDGNEILLYYLKSGETCAVSLTCCMTNEMSSIRAVTNEAVRMIQIPVKFMEEWMKFPDWRQFVMGTYRARFEELLNTMDSIAFHRMDERLVSYLGKKLEMSDLQELGISHQDIATDLHTSREVISRLLKSMEKKGMIELGRNRIRIVDLTLD